MSKVGRASADVLQINIDHISPSNLDDFSVESVKDRLWKQPDLPKKAMPPSFYVLAYINAITGDQVELFDEQQTFRTISILKHWLQHGIPFKFQVVPRKQPLAKDLQLVNKKIGSLIGFGLYRFDYFRDIEVDVFRRTMVSVRREATKNRDPVSYILQPDLDRAPLSEILATKLGQGGRLTVRLHLPFELQSLKTMTCAAHDSPLKLIASLLNKNVPLFGQTYIGGWFVRVNFLLTYDSTSI